jgi:DNA (cytosine-5)-methyltransferase 1
MEWQCGTEISSVWEGVIQFRPSGIRIKKPDNFQSLVAMVQIPIIGKYRRRLTVEEAARLQSFPVDDKEKPYISDENKQQAYKQFGNSVNVEVIKKAAQELFKNE